MAFPAPQSLPANLSDVLSLPSLLDPLKTPMGFVFTRCRAATAPVLRAEAGGAGGRDAQLSIPESRAQGGTSLRNAQTGDPQLETPGSVPLGSHPALCHEKGKGQEVCHGLELSPALCEQRSSLLGAPRGHRI